MKIFGIAGRKGAGKDTFAKPLHEGDGEWKKLAFAAPLKNMLRSLLRDSGLDEDTIERMIEGDLKETPTPYLGGKSPRFAMQTLGTEWRDLIDKNLWLGVAERRLQAYARGGTKGVVITDVRFPHEAAFLKKLNAMVLRIVGKTNPNALSDHASEKQIDDLPVDGEIFNFGTVSDLHAAAEAVSDSVPNCNI